MESTELAGYQATIARYRDLQPLYEKLCGHVQAWCRMKAVALGMYPIVMGRAKTLESFAEKICRPGKSYHDPLNQVTDLCGVRVIVHTLDEVDALAAVVQAEFEVDALNSMDAQMRLGEHEFGYLSRHFVLQLGRPPAIDGLSAEDCARLARFKFELQLRTVAQHAWADIYHALGYKNEFKLPARWEREFARLAAALEACDKDFQAIKDAMRTYESSYGAYMTQEQLRALAERLEILIRLDPNNASAKHRLLRACLALEDADTTLADVLARFGDSLDAHEPALRDKGVALCQLNAPRSEGFAEGVRCLRRAVAAGPRDIDALCSLGGALRRQGADDEAIDCYRRAHELDPTDPYPLGNYVAEELVRRRDPAVVRFFRSAITAAMQRCLRQVEVQVNLPWAWFDLGIFSLFLGDEPQAVAYYARGIVDSPRDWMIRSAGKTIERFLAARVELPGVAAVDKLLKLAWWTRANEAARASSAWKPQPAEVDFGGGPLVVLAGGCGGLTAEYEQKLAELGRLLAGVRGTLIAGGTRSGIAALAGELGARRGPQHLRTVGYVPSLASPTLAAQLDRRYGQLRHSTGNDFSVLEPLLFWEDFLAGGGNPAEVRLLGFNGGRIAGAEFRIALALGARVGIVRGSGRAADAMIADPLWKHHERLRVLEVTSESIDGFIR